MDQFLENTAIVDFDDSKVLAIAKSLVAEGDQTSTVSRCFHWVRDEISHSFDVDARIVSCTASETLRNRTGICYAKSHLLAALLRANGIPSAFGYQRISLDDHGQSFCLHGFNFVYLDDYGWFPVDPRGNSDGIVTEFDPPKVSLAFNPHIAGEQTFDKFYAEPLSCVVECLRESKTVDELRSGLPDMDD